MYAGHLDLTQPLYWTIEGVLTPRECERSIAQMKAATEAEVAPIVGREGYVVDEKVRNNTRVMFDDVPWAKELWRRVQAHVPTQLMGHEVIGVNERIRLYRYGPTQKHGSHWDTPVELPGRQTMLTLVLYLNEDFTGGETVFDELKKSIKPTQGMALLFQHRVLHTAQPVLSGEKFVMRSDIFYRV